MPLACVFILVLAGLLSACSPASSQVPTPPDTGLSLAEAVEIARDAAPERSPTSQADGTQLQYRQLPERYGIPSLNPPPPSDTWVWLIDLAESDRGTFVVIDVHDGTLLQTVRWIA